MGVKTFGGGTAGFAETANPRDGLIVLKCLFRDPTTSTEGPGSAIDVTSPSARVLHNGKPVSVMALGSSEQPDHSYPMLPNAPAKTGLYRFSFLTNRLKPGLYDLEFTGSALLSDSTTTTLLVRGQIGLGEISYVDSLINRLYINLGDDRPELYQLDQPFHLWNVDQLYVFLMEGLSMFNATGPRFTSYGIENFPQVVDHLLIDAARSRALYARARLEKQNEATMSDGAHNLDIKRADSYFQYATGAEKGVLEAVREYKRATPPTTIGLRSQRLPFRVSRVIGLLNSSQTFFS